MTTKSPWPKVDPAEGLSPASLHYLDNLGFFGWQLGLERIERLCNFFGNPQRRYPCVHLAGTNGKGSTAAMLAAIGQAAGLRTGLYTSPHLVRVGERIQINGQPLAGNVLEHYVQRTRKKIDQLQATYFEALTAIAFAYFAEQRVDLALIETGLGGRLDATNVVMPEVSIITSISLEHQQYLGSTLRQIAKEKAGIIKAGRPCVSGVRVRQAQQVLVAQCRQQHAAFLHAPHWARVRALELSATASVFGLSAPAMGWNHAKLRLSLPGRHQVDNARLAVLAAHLLRQRGFSISASAISTGLEQTRWPTRMQLLDTSPPLLVDAAHNPESMRVLAAGIRQLFPRHKLYVVMALLADKSAAQVLRPWQDLHPHFFFVPAATSRALPPARLAQVARHYHYHCEVFASARAGLEAAQHQTRGRALLVVAGSHYLLGELMAEGLLPYPYLKNLHLGENA